MKQRKLLKLLITKKRLGQPTGNGIKILKHFSVEDIIGKLVMFLGNRAAHMLVNFSLCSKRKSGLKIVRIVFSLVFSR